VLEELLAEAHRVEGHRARAKHPEAGAAHPARHTAHRGELAQVGAETVGLRINGVQRRQAEGDAVLTQVVAQRHLAAEAIAPPLQVHLGRIVRESVNEHRHAQVGEAQRVGDAALVAEVGQRDQHAVNLVAVRAEQLGAGVRFRQALHAAESGVLRAERDDLDALLREHLQHCLAPRFAQMAGEKSPVADNYP